MILESKLQLLYESDTHEITEEAISILCTPSKDKNEVKNSN